MFAIVKTRKMKKYLITILIFIGCLFAYRAQAAITFNSSSTAIFNGFSAGKTVTSTLSVSSNANRYAIACISVWQDVAGTGTASGASIGGVAMTKIVTSTRQASMAVEAWGLIAPASGSRNVSTTIVGNIDAVKVVWSQFDGVDQTNPVEATSTGLATLKSVTTTITTVNANAVINECVSRFGTEALTPKASQTQIYNNVTGSVGAAGSYKNIASPGSQTVGWTWITNDRDASEAAVSMKPAAAAQVATRRRFPGISR